MEWNGWVAESGRHGRSPSQSASSGIVESCLCKIRGLGKVVGVAARVSVQNSMHTQGRLRLHTDYGKYCCAVPPS